jgi:hypothetical protein
MVGVNLAKPITIKAIVLPPSIVNVDVQNAAYDQYRTRDPHLPRAVFVKKV